jgi:hypothetical protein
VSNGPEPIEVDLTTNDIYPIVPAPEVIAAMEEDSETYVRSQRWNWLASTYALQRESFGMNLPLASNTNYLADYVTTNHSALVIEASELMDEFGWKPWAQPRGWVNRDNALKEAVDVAHFLANILCAIGVTDQEWEDAYRKKQEVNRQRQRAGYDGVTGKCLGCKRSYDDGVDCTPGGDQVDEINASGSVVITSYTEPYCAYV